MSDQNLKPITPDRMVAEIRKLSEGRKSGQYNADEYEHRFARMIGELRDRRIDGNRAELIADVPARFTAKPGMLHGGAPPVFHRGEYYCFYHRRLGASAEKFYSLDLYTFEAKPPFRPSRQTAMPLLIPDAQDRPAPGLGRQRDRARHLRAGLLGRADDVRRGGVDDRVVESLQSDADAAGHMRDS